MAKVNEQEEQNREDLSWRWKWGKYVTEAWERPGLRLSFVQIMPACFIVSFNKHFLSMSVQAPFQEEEPWLSIGKLGPMLSLLWEANF